MASNYFTRPKGLHPTPSACYPPPPPPPKYPYTAEAAPDLDTITAGGVVQIEYWANDPTAPGTHQVTVTFTGAGTCAPTTPIPDDHTPLAALWTAPLTPGIATFNFRFRWSPTYSIIVPMRVTVTP